MTPKYNTLTEFYREEIAPKLDKTDGWLAFDETYILYWYKTKPEFTSSIKTWSNYTEDFERLGAYPRCFDFDVNFSESLQSVIGIKIIQPNKKYDSFYDFYRDEIIPSLDKKDGYLAMDDDYEVFWFSKKPEFYDNRVWTAKNSDYSNCELKNIKTVDASWFYEDVCFNVSMYPVAHFYKEENVPTYNTFRDFYLEEVMSNITKKNGYLAMDSDYKLYWYTEKPGINYTYEFWYAVDHTDSEYIKRYSKNIFAEDMLFTDSLYSIEELLPVEVTKLYKLTGLADKEFGIVTELELGQFFGYAKDVTGNNTHVLTTSSGYIFFSFNTMLYRAELI